MKRLVTLLAIATTLAPLALRAQENPYTQDVLLREGTFYSKYSVAGQVYVNGHWLPDPYNSDAELFEEIGLNPDGSPKSEPPTEAEIITSLWGNGMTAEQGADSWGYANLAAMLADPNMGGPYTDLQTLYADWTQKGWVDDLSTPYPTDLAGILSDPAKTAGFLGRLNSLPSEAFVQLTTDPSITTEVAASMLTAIQALPYTPTGLGNTPAKDKARQNLLTQALNPESQLYADRSQLDFSQTQLYNFSVVGLNLQGLNITGAQLSQVAGANSFGPADYTGTNFTGLNMTGFNPRVQTMSTLGNPPQTFYIGGSFNNANFTNAQNLTASMFARAASLNGTNFTGTGITRQALIDAIMTTTGTTLQNATNLTANAIF